MLFSSISFIYVFLPILTVFYFVANQVDKKIIRKNESAMRQGHLFSNTVLLSASLLFYFLGEPVFFWVLLAEGMTGYVTGVYYYKGNRKTKGMLWFSCFLCVGMLVCFKYIPKSILPDWLKLTLPLGISFYTFQIISYMIDVYHERVPAEKNPFWFLLYVSFFPQLVAGPIVRYEEVANSIRKREHGFEQFGYGCKRLVWGLSKKVLLANAFGEFCTIFRQSDEKTVLFYWLYGIAFSMQIYFDFAGYSDMAIGLGAIFGFRFPENFRYPFAADSITDFWRRWHMTLGQWFRDYVYIPLGGNRVATGRFLFNLFVVWGLTGWWHGAELNFPLWGLYFAFLLMLEKLFFKKWLEKHCVTAHFYVILLVVISFVIFNGNGLNGTLSDLSAMFGLQGLPITGAVTAYYFKSFFVLFLVGIFFSIPRPECLLKGKIGKWLSTSALAAFGEIIVLILCLFLVTGYLIDGSFNPFLYFRF